MQELNSKKCNRCNEIKSFSLFRKDKSKKDGLSTLCKDCKIESDSIWKANNKSHISLYNKNRYETIKEKILPINRLWKKNNKKSANIHNKNWQAKNKERCKELSKNWFQNNPSKRKQYNIDRNIGQKKSTPKWASVDSMDNFYKYAKFLTLSTGEKFHVDHIVPIKGKIGRVHVVCGLHTHQNLQVIKAKENLSKNCYQWPDMW